MDECPLYFTLRVLVAAKAATAYQASIYPVTLPPGRLYCVIDLGAESLIAASTDNSHEVYWIPINYPAHWQRFQLTREDALLP